MASKHWWVETAHQTIGKTTVTSWSEEVYVMTTKSMSKKKLTEIMTDKWTNRRNELCTVAIREMFEDSEDMFKLNAERRPNAVRVYEEGELAPCNYISGVYYHELKATPEPGDTVMINGTCAIRTLKLGNSEKCFPGIYFGDPTRCKKVIRFNK